MQEGGGGLHVVRGEGYMGGCQAPILTRVPPAFFGHGFWGAFFWFWGRGGKGRSGSSCQSARGSASNVSAWSLRVGVGEGDAVVKRAVGIQTILQQAYVSGQTWQVGRGGAQRRTHTDEDYGQMGGPAMVRQSHHTRGWPGRLLAGSTPAHPWSTARKLVCLG